MPSFTLYDLNPEFWAKVQAKAAAEGVSPKALILRLLTVWLTAGVLVMLTVACGYKLPTEPTTIAVVPSSAPASIRLGVSSMTTSTYGITATVLTSDGHFVRDVEVTFAMDSGSVSPATAMTNVNGVAQAVATASTTAATLTVSGGSLTSTTTIAGTPAVMSPTPSAPPPSVPLPAPFVSLQPVTTTVGATTLFTIGGFMPGGAAITSVSWAFGDGATASTNSGTTSHTYTTAGNFTASVTATDTLGRSASNSAPVTVNALPTPTPTPAPGPAALAASMTCSVAAHVVSCNVAAAYGGTPLPSSAITRVDWDLGDGQVPATTVPVVSHTYAQPGTYRVVATVHANATIDGAFVPKIVETSAQSIDIK